MAIQKRSTLADELPNSSDITPPLKEPETDPNAKFYGPHQIASEKIDQKTQKVTMYFKQAQGATPVMPITVDPDIYNATVTSTVSDLTTLRDKRVRVMVSDILSILLKRNMQLSEVEYLMSLMGQSIEMSLAKASEILWGSTPQQRTLEDVDKVLKNAPASVKQSVKSDVASADQTDTIA